MRYKSPLEYSQIASNPASASPSTATAVTSFHEVLRFSAIGSLH